MSINVKGLIGKAIGTVGLSEDGSEFQITFQDGSVKSYAVEGDCCSRSWIEHLEAPHDLAGAVLLGIEDSDSITSDHDAHDEENGGDSIQVYNTRFRTSKGDIVLEFRNSSNGYYGGWLTEVSR